MTKYKEYREIQAPVPEKSWAWNLYGAGLDSMGKNGEPELVDIPEPGPDQMLVRVDAVSLCFSDVKIIKLGSAHPKLYNRDMMIEPTRLGHETSVTVIKVGENLQDRYSPGQFLSIQPDVYQNGMSTAYGYTVPGGLIQYHLIGPEMLVTDTGECLVPVKDKRMSYAAASLLEPWGCVLAAFTHRRRLTPKDGGVMWILGRPGEEKDYQFSVGLEAPAKIVLTDVPKSILDMIKEKGLAYEERNGISMDAFSALSEECTGGEGFDDIVVLDPRSASRVSQIARLIARRGTMNMMGQTPLDGLVEMDLSRLHYDYIALLGNTSSDIGASYGEERNRCELRQGGLTLMIGAGGPMGQMHVQRAIEYEEGPSSIIATEVNAERLATLKERFVPLAESKGKQLYVINPAEDEQSLADLVKKVSNGRGADDVVVCVPVAKLMTEGASLMSPDGMLVFFAGVPSGTMAPLNLSCVYLHNAQYTGTSGLRIEDQELVLDRALANALSPDLSVAAIGGMKTAKEAYQSLIDGRFPGKITIFPQIHDMPLMGLDEIKDTMPEVAEKLGPGDAWTKEAEKALFEHWL